jgi:hypothetical protein
MNIEPTNENAYTDLVLTQTSELETIIKKFGYDSVKQFNEVLTSANIGMDEVLVSDTYIAVKLNDTIEVLSKKLNYKSANELRKVLDDLGISNTLDTSLGLTQSSNYSYLTLFV